MLVSRNALQSYPQLAGINNPYYFATRAARNSYFGTTQISAGQYCAVLGDPTSSLWDTAEWEVEQYNGTNWAVLSLDSNFALIVTQAGLNALSDAKTGSYKLQLSRIAVKQTRIADGQNIRTWTAADFLTGVYGYTDICLDTNNTLNSTFTLANNLSYRTNLLNGGIQFSVLLDINCMGQQLADPGSGNPTLTEFNVSTIGLFVKKPNTQEDVLLAVANLPTSVKKYASTPEKVGNALKFYLNTTLTNLGTVTDLTVLTSSINSIAEVQSETELVTNYDGVSAPYNLYLVDDYAGTNIPALAVRRGNPTAESNPITWMYFTPTDDKLKVSTEVVDPSLIDFMIAAWDPSTQKYVPADGDSSTQQLAGLYNNSYIIYAGNVVNDVLGYTYNIVPNYSNATGYRVGEELVCTAQAVDAGSSSVTFNILIINIDSTGKPSEIKVTPASGNNNVSTNGDVFVAYAPSSSGNGVGLKMNITSVARAAHYTWNFPSSWVNGPLYAAKGANAGKLTNVATEMFVGWCTGSNSIKLALDLRNEATYVTYGVTRYATNTETKDVTNNPSASVETCVVPANLQANYVQKTLVAGNPGESAANPVVVDSHVKFNQTIVGPSSGIAFQGTAYRALWADLAEYYKADKIYPCGTLIAIGAGLEEITEAKTECNGIISTKPGYELGEKHDAFDLPVALVGKVPVLFAEDCVPRFGDRIYLSRTVPGKASTIPNGKCLGKIIDKREHLDQVNTIMCSVRISF